MTAIGLRYTQCQRKQSVLYVHGDRRNSQYWVCTVIEEQESGVYMAKEETGRLGSTR